MARADQPAPDLLAASNAASNLVRRHQYAAGGHLADSASGVAALRRACDGTVMAYRDRWGEDLPLAIFVDGRRVADAPDNLQEAYKLRNRLRDEHGWHYAEVLRVCPEHPDSSVVDCLVCSPIEGD